MTINQIKADLEGQEISSLKYEGIVGVFEGKLLRDGVEIKNPDWKTLFEERTFNEYGTNNINTILKMEGF